MFTKFLLIVSFVGVAVVASASDGRSTEQLEQATPCQVRGERSIASCGDKAQSVDVEGTVTKRPPHYTGKSEN